jgi:hypothetical protein
MPACRALLALLLCASLGLCAELRTLKGDLIKGDVIRITEKEIVLAQDGKETATPLGKVLQLDFGPSGKITADTKFTDVELTDGTLLHCKQFALKGKELSLTLLGGQEVKVDLGSVGNLLNDAQDEKNRKEWTTRLAKKRPRDVVAVLKDGVVNPLEGTLGEGNAEGTHVDFTLAGGRQIPFPLARVHGLIFVRTHDPNAAPIICKVTDTNQNAIMASGVASTPTGVTVTTPAGVKIDYTNDLLARLDYSKGKLSYLSDIEPMRVVETSTEDRVEHYRRDVSLENTPLRLDGKEYGKGLAMHAYTELEYDLKGEYLEFKGFAGIDDGVGGLDGPVVLTIEGDGIKLRSETFNRQDKKDRVREIKVNVKDVQRLRIIVSSADLLDLGKHLDLADAKVTK